MPKAEAPKASKILDYFTNAPLMEANLVYDLVGAIVRAKRAAGKPAGEAKAASTTASAAGGPKKSHKKKPGPKPAAGTSGPVAVAPPAGQESDPAGDGEEMIGGVPLTEALSAP